VGLGRRGPGRWRGLPWRALREKGEKEGAKDSGETEDSGET
jgi:hypothetical protein